MRPEVDVVSSSDHESRRLRAWPGMTGVKAARLFLFFFFGGGGGACKPQRCGKKKKKLHLSHSLSVNLHGFFVDPSQPSKAPELFCGKQPQKKKKRELLRRLETNLASCFFFFLFSLMVAESDMSVSVCRCAPPCRIIRRPVYCVVVFFFLTG